jgi:hypothetical protein
VAEGEAELGTATRGPSFMLGMGTRAVTLFALEHGSAEVRPPNHALKWTAPVASLGVRPLSYCRSAASRTWVSSPWLGLHGTVGLGTGRHR